MSFDTANRSPPKDPRDTPRQSPIYVLAPFQLHGDIIENSELIDSNLMHCSL